MKTKLHAPLIALAISLLTAPFSMQAQVGTQLAVSNSPAYEQAASRLRSAPPRQYNFSKAVLGDIMRLMAEDAGISFFGLPEGAAGGDRIVTFTINASPFKALETLAKANGVSLIFENDIWYLRPADDKELVGRIYQINYNSQELIKKNDQAGGSISGNQSNSSSGGGQSGTSSIGLNLQGAPDFFVVEPSRILEDVRGILDIRTSGVSATFAPTASVDNTNSFSVAGLQTRPDVVVRGRDEEGSEEEDGAKVIWNSDSNSLYVVASRQQHQWIEGYLAAADKPQPMIAVEVKFLEINKNPRRDLGIDWTGVLSSNGQGGYGTHLYNTEDSGANFVDTALNLDRLGDYVLPTAILSYDDLQVRLNALFQDQRNRTVSYPRMVTLDNREVSFRSVVNQPVLSSTASASLGAGATQTSSVEYVPIGTVINILPKRMANEQILLNVSVTISDIVGTETINGNPFPIATSRVYTAPVNVKSGYTVAISGLDKASSEETKTGIPVLGRIPVLGFLAKKRGRNESKQHLMMLITPVVLHPGEAGVTERPMSQDPWNGGFDYPQENAHFKNIKDDLTARTNSDLRRSDTELLDPTEIAVATPVETAPETGAVSAEQMMIAEAAQNADASEKKSLRIFGKKQPEAATPTTMTLTARKAESTAIAPGSAATAGEVVTLNRPGRLESPPLPGSEPKKAAPTVAKPILAAVPAQPKKAPGEAYGDKANSAQSTAVQKIVSDAKKIDTTLAKIPGGDSRLSPDDGQVVRNAYDDSKRLIGEIEKLRQTKDVPMQGELSDAWWKLVTAKSKAVKLSQRAPESLAININEEDE